MSGFDREISLHVFALVLPSPENFVKISGKERNEMESNEMAFLYVCITSKQFSRCSINHLTSIYLSNVCLAFDFMPSA